MYCELDLMTSLKDTKLLARVAWLAADCFVQLIVIATLTMEQELVSALCSEYTIIPSYTPRPPHYQHLLPTAAAAALSYRHLNDVWQWWETRLHSSMKVVSIWRKRCWHLKTGIDGWFAKQRCWKVCEIFADKFPNIVKLRLHVCFASNVSNLHISPPLLSSVSGGCKFRSLQLGISFISLCNIFINTAT